jgi:sugar (pentulose or hexulose) kinase
MEGKDFPELLPADAIGGKVTKEAALCLGIPTGVPVVSGGHDQYCASLGAGATGEGDCLLSCGTAWALLLCTRKLLFDLRSRWVPGRHLKAGTFGLMAAISDGGVVLDWVRKNVRMEKGTCEEESRVTVIPYFSRKQGAIGNLSLGTSGRDIYLAALNALAWEVKNYLGQVGDKARVKRLLMVGGGTREKLLPAIIEEVTGQEVVLPEVTEAAGRGAALLALQCHSALDAESNDKRRTSCHTGQM